MAYTPTQEDFQGAQLGYDNSSQNQAPPASVASSTAQENNNSSYTPTQEDLEGAQLGYGSNSQSQPVGSNTYYSPYQAAAAAQRMGNPSTFNPENIGADVASGLAQGGRGLIDLGAMGLRGIGDLVGSKVLQNIPDLPQRNFSQEFGAGSSTPDNLIQGAASYAPFGGAGSFVNVGKGILPFLAKDTAVGAAYGAGSSPSAPLEGAAVGGATNALLGGASAALSSSIKNMLGNRILNNLSKTAQVGGNLSPEETAANVASNYTDQLGNPIRVDIGTATNRPFFGKLYNTLSSVPFSGIGNKINLANNAIRAANVGGLENELTDNLSSGAQNFYGIQNQLKNSSESNNGIISGLQAQLDDLQNNKVNLDSHINAAPSVLNNLGASLGDPVNITKDISNAVSHVADETKQISDANYSDLNNSNIRLDQISGDNFLPNYKSAATDLLAKQENLQNLFGSDSDLGTTLKGELSKAQTVIDGTGEDYGMTVPDAVSRIQNLGKLAASAYSNGKKYEASLIGNLGNSLSQDLNDALNNSGNGDLANQLQSANQYYKDYRVPLWTNPEIRKTVTNNGYISTGAKLASALHDPNYKIILNQLPSSAKNAALYQMITAGKVTSSGISNLTPIQISKRYQTLLGDKKYAVKSYNPSADSYLESLPSAISSQNDLQNQYEGLLSQLGAAQKSATKQSNSLQNQLDKMSQSNAASAQKIRDKIDLVNQSKYQKINKEGGVGPLVLGGLGSAFAGAAYLHPHILAGLPIGSLLARGAGNVLDNPDLLQAYINKTKLSSAFNPNRYRTLSGALQSTITPAFTGGNQ